MPSVHQGVQFRGGKDPVNSISTILLECLAHPAAACWTDYANYMNCVLQKHSIREVNACIAQYEMAFRMQTSVPEATDMSSELESTFDMYGPDSREPGTFAANCLLARKLAERDVRFIQLFHRGWDQHSNLPGSTAQCGRATDQPCATLIRDLKQRGMLEDTLVVWGAHLAQL